MRIRKRRVPLPLSSLSPVPLTDPLFLSLDRLPPVQLPQQDPRPIHAAVSEDPDRLLPKEDLSPDYLPLNKESGDEGKARGGEGSSHHHHSRADAGTAEKSTSLTVSASLPHEGQTTSLMKNRLSSSGDVDGNGSKMKKKKTNASSLGNNRGRRKGRGGIGSTGGGTSMEGSRCSRVNGRGWRCSQQTLVGYSLCEHHLGKGRLRSMMNVRSSSTVPSTEASGKGSVKLDATRLPAGIDPELLLPLGSKEGNTFLYNMEEEDDDDVEDDSTTNGKKKARSMSSLLGQVRSHSNNAGASAASSVVEGRCL